MLQLDKRLMLMASYMTPGVYGVDVGTDHGYLAVFLVQSGMAKRMLATGDAIASTETSTSILISPPCIF